MQVDIRQLDNPPSVSLPPSPRGSTHRCPAAARFAVVLLVVEGITTVAAEPGAAQDVLAKLIERNINPAHPAPVGLGERHGVLLQPLLLPHRTRLQRSAICERCGTTLKGGQACTRTPGNSGSGGQRVCPCFVTT